MSSSYWKAVKYGGLASVLRNFLSVLNALATL